jgi:hypothetical protein
MTAFAEPRESQSLTRSCVQRLVRGSSLVLGLVGAFSVLAQAPPGPEQPWTIPESAIRRAEGLGNTSSSIPHKLYDLAALVDLAER